MYNVNQDTATMSVVMNEMNMWPSSQTHTEVILHTDTLKHTYAAKGSEAHKRANGWIEERSATPIWT